MRVSNPEMTRRELLVRGALSAGSLALAGVAMEALSDTGKSSAEAATPSQIVRPSGRIAIGVVADIPTMDPQGHYSFQGFTVQSHIFDGLVEQDAAGNLRPALAMSWDQPDPKALRFRLKPGAQFHNGDPFTSQSVKYTLERLVNPATRSPQAFLWRTLDRVETPDDLTAVVRFNEPNAAALRNFSITYMLSPNARDFGQPIGTGPFRVTEWLKGNRLVARAVLDHWRGAPRLEEITFRFLPEPSTRMAAIEAGEVDITESLFPEQLQTLQRRTDLAVMTVVANESQYVGLNLTRSQFADVRVRQALNYAVDKQNLLKNLLLGHATLATAPMPPGVPGFNGSLAPYPYDPGKARQLLREAGVGGFRMRLNGFRGFLPKGLEVEQAIASMLGDLGITVDVEDMEFARMFEARAAGNFDAIYSLWGVLTGDADFALARNFASGNFFKYSNTEVDLLFSQALAASDPAVRAEIYKRAQSLVWRDCPWIWLWYGETNNVVRNRVKGYKPRVDKLVIVKDAWIER